MIILLPPSEGKTGATRSTGRPLLLARLSLPALTVARAQVLDALTELCATDPAAALAVLGLSAGQGDEVARNAALRTAPTRAAGRLYTGVLYAALDLASLTPAARARLTRSVFVCSGLWGLVRLNDPVPAYRCAIGVRLPGVGALTAHWRRALAGVLPAEAGGGLVLDLRSTGYQEMWAPRGPQARQVAAVRVLHERTVDGVTSRTVVSHFNKATKGRLLRDLATAGAKPASPAELAVALRDLKYDVTAAAPTVDAPWRLDVTVRDL